MRELSYGPQPDRCELLHLALGCGHGLSARRLTESPQMGGLGRTLGPAGPLRVRAPRP